MKACLLAAAAILGVAAPIDAHAAYTCGYARQTAGRPDNNPVVQSAIGMNDAHTRWAIVHTLADGKVIDRSTQYDTADRTDNTTIQWGGQHLRHPNLWMAGVWVQTAPTHAVYTETLYDRNQGNKIIARDEAQCDKYFAPAQAPAPVYTPAPVPGPAPSYSSPGGTAQAGDAVPLTMVEGAMHVNVNISGRAVDMMLDTGANVSTVTASLADAMISNDQATEGPGMNVAMADGSTRHERSISVKTLTFGGHTRHNVIMGVAPDGAMMLLGLPVLNAIGKFTIDAPNNALIFG